MKLHPGRSIKTNLANVMKTQLKLAAMIDALNGKALDLLELRTRLEELLPEAERPEQPQVLHIKVPAVGYETATGYEGDDPNAPQATWFEEHKGDGPVPPAGSVVSEAHASVAVLEPEIDPVSVLDSIAQAHRDPGAPPVSLKDIQQGVAELRRRRGGWPLGLSRKLTVCKAWPQRPAHRHRVNGDDVYCVEPLAGQSRAQEKAVDQALLEGGVLPPLAPIIVGGRLA